MSAGPSASQQGSAAFVLVIGGVAMIAVGAMVLTFFMYPMMNAFMDSVLWGGLETAPGQRVETYVGGAWEFTGGILMIGIMVFMWVHTRQ